MKFRPAVAAGGGQRIHFRRPASPGHAGMNIMSSFWVVRLDTRGGLFLFWIFFAETTQWSSCGLRPVPIPLRCLGPSPPRPVPIPLRGLGPSLLHQFSASRLVPIPLRGLGPVPSCALSAFRVTWSRPLLIFRGGSAGRLGRINLSQRLFALILTAWARLGVSSRSHRALGVTPNWAFAMVAITA